MPEPTAKGTFAKTPLAHLLVYAHDRELTGTFEFEGPAGQTATVLFIEGQPTKARVANANIYLGKVLFELGILSDEQLAILLPRLLGSKELHGQVLLTEGLITEEQLELGLRAQLVRQMQTLVHLPPETVFRFYDCFDGLAAYGGDGHVGVDPFPVVWACIRDAPPWEHVQAGLAGVAASGLQLTETAETTRFAFDKAERTTVELLRQRPWRVHELTAAGTMAPRLVQLLVYCLLVTKQVQLVRESKLPDAAGSSAESAAGDSSTDLADDSSEEIPDAPPSAPFGNDVLGPAAPAPRKVARVQLAQRPVTRTSAAIEEDSVAAPNSTDARDGKTSYVATQPRTFKKRVPTNADALTKVDPRPASAAPPAIPTVTVPVASRPEPPPPTTSSASPKDHEPRATPAPASPTLPPAASTLVPPPAGTATPLVPPPGLAGSGSNEASFETLDDDIFRNPTPAAGMQAVSDPHADDDAIDGGPAPRGVGAEVHTRPTVPKMTAVTSEEIAAHVAAQDAKAKSPRPAAVNRAPPTRLPAGAPQSLTIETPKNEQPVVAPPPVPSKAPAPSRPAVAPPAPPPLPRPRPPTGAAVPAAAPAAATPAASPAAAPPPAAPAAVARPPIVPAAAPGASPTIPPSSSRGAPTSVIPSSAPRSSEPPSARASIPPPSTRAKPAPISVKEQSDDDDDDPPSSRAGSASLRAMQMTAELVNRKKEIQEKAAVIDKEDYFTVLGVAKDTPAPEIQKAFFALAKKWHPDRVPPVLADVKDLCAKVFARMSEAHQTLMDPTKRAKYEASKKAGSDDSPEAQAQVIAILEAATNFQKAEICLKRNDFKQAEEFCKKAIDVEPKQADYIAMMAWLQSLKPTKQDPLSTQDQVAELTRAIGISQACERAFFYRAMLLKRLGQEPQAMKDFKRAMELNPRNVDATREVRLYNMRGGDKSKPAAGKKDEGGGLFGKLFKK